MNSFRIASLFRVGEFKWIFVLTQNSEFRVRVSFWCCCVFSRVRWSCFFSEQVRQWWRSSKPSRAMVAIVQRRSRSGGGGSCGHAVAVVAGGSAVHHIREMGSAAITVALLCRVI